MFVFHCIKYVRIRDFDWSVRGVFRTQPNISDRAFCWKLLTIFTKISILDISRGSEYVSVSILPHVDWNKVQKFNCESENLGTQKTFVFIPHTRIYWPHKMRYSRVFYTRLYRLLFSVRLGCNSYYFQLLRFCYKSSPNFAKI